MKLLPIWCVFYRRRFGATEAVLVFVLTWSSVYSVFLSFFFKFYFSFFVLLNALDYVLWAYICFYSLHSGMEMNDLEVWMRNWDFTSVLGCSAHLLVLALPFSFQKLQFCGVGQVLKRSRGTLMPASLAIVAVSSIQSIGCLFLWIMIAVCHVF